MGEGRSIATKKSEEVGRKTTRELVVRREDHPKMPKNSNWGLGSGILVNPIRARTGCNKEIGERIKMSRKLKRRGREMFTCSGIPE